MSDLKDLGPYFGASRLRKDLWNTLKTTLGSLINQQSATLNKEAELISSIEKSFSELSQLEVCWAFPGNSAIQHLKELIRAKDWPKAYGDVTLLARLISTDHYRNQELIKSWYSNSCLFGNDAFAEQMHSCPNENESKPYFEVLVVDSLALESEQDLRTHHLKSARPEDPFVYNVVIACSFQDALCSILLNYDIQSCVLRYTFPWAGKARLGLAGELTRTAGFNLDEIELMPGPERTQALASIIKALRPEIDLYLLSESSVEDVSARVHMNFRRCFFGSEDYPEMRLSILKGVSERYETPFFNALKHYTERPTGVFHALPISRGKSISKSHWIQDYGIFYGDRMFLAETSSTTGGLDSLLQPSGSIMKSQELAAKAFGSDRCLFITNGTSTANKVVFQALFSEEDIILMASDNHKSHHYAAILTGARIHILETTKIERYGIYGGIPKSEIRKTMLKYKAEGKLEHVKAIVITNLTFDGIAYNLKALIMECLSIKPDLIFLVDEAWFAYGIFSPITRKRSAMYVANQIRDMLRSSQYREMFDKHMAMVRKNSEETALPDPDKAIVRVYSTQSTHKTLTALRQASMIHIIDEAYDSYVKASLIDAYHCHTSTSPNAQILASLDIARRQVHLEGYELVQKAFELALILRKSILSCDLLSRYINVLEEDHMIPSHLTQGSINNKTNDIYWNALDVRWTKDEFALDPTRITLDISKMPYTGSELKEVLMSRFDIQVNKTSTNTILLIIHIGATRGMVTYLIESLKIIASELLKSESIRESLDASSRANSITLNQMEKYSNKPVCLPSPCAQYHPLFTNQISQYCQDLDIRKANALANDNEACSLIQLSYELSNHIQNGLQVVSASVVTPYPPGFPILLPGQIMTSDVVEYLLQIQKAEIHGLLPDFRLKIFKNEYLERSLRA